MENVRRIIEEVELLAGQHVPESWLANGVPIAILLLLGGILLSVLGAKLARFGMTSGFVVLGGVIGVVFSRLSGVHVVICVAIGATVVGLIGHLTYRVWVGVAAAVVVSSFALGTFSHHRVLPYLPEFDARQAMPTANETVAGFAIPSPQEQRRHLERDPKQWAKEYWAYVTGKDPSVSKDVRAVAMVALLLGLLFGLLASRVTLIVTTSAVGTLLVALSIASLAARGLQNGYQAFLDRPELSGVLLGGFFTTSLILQYVLTRKAAAPQRGKAGTS